MSWWGGRGDKICHGAVGGIAKFVMVGGVGEAKFAVAG